MIDLIRKSNGSSAEKLESKKVEELKGIAKEILLRQKKIKRWINLDKNNDIFKSLPRFEYYDSNEYEDPENYLKKILSSSYRDILSDTNVKQKLDAFQKAISDRLKKEISELEAFLKNSLSAYIHVRNISVNPNIDPSKSFVSTIINVDDGRGPHDISKRGEGIKKLLFAYITEWESKKEKKENIIRVYDEPDNSLHYHAQREFFKAISGQKNLQVIIATHSIVLAEMAPFHKIILLKINKGGYTEVDYLRPQDIEEIDRFLIDLGGSLGISARDFFLEKAILIVEGSTEENFIPIAYKKLFGDELKTKGIVLINIEGNGAAPYLLKLLKHKQEKVVLLLDNDTKYKKWRKNKTIEKLLKEFGYDDKFIDNNIFYIGNLEFEDSFSDEIIIKVARNLGCTNLNALKGKLINLRKSITNKKIKFSEKLIKILQDCCPSITKPQLGIELAKVIDETTLPQVLNNLFYKINTLIEKT